MPLFRGSDSLFLFVHIPKTGGTSIERFLGKRFNKALYDPKFKQSQSLRAPCNPQHFHAELLDRLFPPGFLDFEFAVVRNPLDRLLSEYKWRKKNAKSDFPRAEQWFEEILERYAKNPYVLDNHIRPQKEFITSGCSIFKYEDGLGAALQAVFEENGFGTEGVSALERRNATPPEDIQVSPRLRKLVENFYSQDYNSFGYV